MSADRRVTQAVNEVLDLAPRHGEVSLVGLVAAVGTHRSRPIAITTTELPPGVSGQWRQFADHDEFLIQEGLPTVDRTLAHELGHLVLGHEGIPVTACAMSAPRNGRRVQINIDAPLIARTVRVNRAASLSTSESRRSAT